QNVFGEDYYAFEQQDTHFIVLNAQLFNTGFTAEKEQWAWLEKTLDNKPELRSFVFLHYPPYIVWDNEIEHYDNIGEPSRSRLLA
ncbi:MAG: serine/threonine protein phosphatase, partial [Candidatus Competibacteraceae bacterium]|nr:serine/threonine protein phosphatase [Candidatus Competibacteraceae bacterium]